jgi:hypothetical protein
MFFTITQSLLSPYFSSTVGRVSFSPSQMAGLEEAEEELVCCCYSLFWWLVSTGLL